MGKCEGATSLQLQDYAPRSNLVVPEHMVRAPRFPVVDIHSHLGATFGRHWSQRPADELVLTLDEAGVVGLVDLDGGWGRNLRHHLNRYKKPYPDRFFVFAGVDWSQFGAQGDNFGTWAAGELSEAMAMGAQGLKVWKELGLHVRDGRGELVPIDDHRLDPLWARAAELSIPVLIHVADPVAAFQPLDRFNERYRDLNRHREWHYYGSEFPSFEELVAQFSELVERHRATTFIGAHVGCYAENLGFVGDLLDRCPNFHVDIARIAELGRQPYTARRFFIHYQDRILFGTDRPAEVAMYRLYYRFLETTDEHFDYTLDPNEGNWRIYGLHLPDKVLEKIYHLNARGILSLQNECGRIEEE